MKQLLLLITLALLIAVMFSACGPSEDEQNATATAIAAGIFATQTAGAPTVTPTPTNTATPTATPIPEPTHTPTPTPEPTETPAPTPASTATTDPAADLAAALPVPEELPSGFQELPSGFMDSTLGVGTEEAIGPNVAFVNPATSEFIIAFLSPMESGIQRSVFEQQVEDPAALVDMMGLGFQASGAVDAEVDYADLAELSDIGEKAGGVRSFIELDGSTFIYDVILFLRDDVGAVVGVLHPEIVETELDVREVARLVDGRLVQLSGELGGDASGLSEQDLRDVVAYLWMLQWRPRTGLHNRGTRLAGGSHWSGEAAGMIFWVLTNRGRIGRNVRGLSRSTSTLVLTQEPRTL